MIKILLFDSLIKRIVISSLIIFSIGFWWLFLHGYIINPVLYDGSIIFRADELPLTIYPPAGERFVGGIKVENCSLYDIEDSIELNEQIESVAPYELSGDLIKNGDFEEWGSDLENKVLLPAEWGTAAGVTKVEQIVDKNKVKSGNSSVKITSGGGSGFIYQDVERFDEMLYRKITVSAWVWSDKAHVARLLVNDGYKDYVSDLHPGGGQFHNLSVSYFINLNTRWVRIIPVVTGGENNAIFDDLAINVSSPFVLPYPTKGQPEIVIEKKEQNGEIKYIFIKNSSFPDYAEIPLSMSVFYRLKDISDISNFGFLTFSISSLRCSPKVKVFLYDNNSNQHEIDSTWLRFRKNITNQVELPIKKLNIDGIKGINFKFQDVCDGNEIILEKISLVNKKLMEDEVKLVGRTDDEKVVIDISEKKSGVFLLKYKANYKSKIINVFFDRFFKTM